jgi:predicted ester cyclase
MLRWSMTGTHGGELMGVPSTGRPIDVTGFDLFRVEEGKLAELWQNWDQLGLMQQIGAVPVPA